MIRAESAMPQLPTGCADAVRRSDRRGRAGARTETLAGIVLAGGMSRRMGGGDKTQLNVGGKPLIAHALGRLQSQARRIAINSNGDPECFARFSVPVIKDSIEGRAGPLAGVLAGMDWAAAQGCKAVVSVAGDTPFFPPDLTGRLVEAARLSDIPIMIAASRNSDNELVRHPTFGLWPVGLREDLRKALAGGVRKVVAWADKHGIESVEFERGEVDPFFNINTREDLEFARELLAQGALR